MAIMRSVNSFLVARYTVFALFTICNAITCSVAVWNYGLVHFIQPAQVDIYLIFLGAFSLLSIFTIIFVELLCVNSLTTRVWFECAWVTLFWLLELAGGAALIAIESDIACSRPTTPLTKALCTSERVLLAFTWTCTIMLLLYLLVVVFIAASQYGEDLKVWVSDVRALGAAVVRRHPLSAPNPPLTTRVKIRPNVDIRGPLPTHVQPVSTFSQGLGREYKIKHFHPMFATPEQLDILHSLDLREAAPLPLAPIIPASSYMKPVPPVLKEERNVRSLSLCQYSARRESSNESARLGRPSRFADQSNSLPLPSPLGDWPRPDAMQLPTKPKRKPSPPSASEFPKEHPTTAPASIDRAFVPADANTSGNITQPRPRRPSGPRLRTPSGESGHRPAPLNLSDIKHRETGCRDVTG